MNKYLQPYPQGMAGQLRQATSDINAVNSYVEAVLKNKDIRLEAYYENMLYQQVNSLYMRNMTTLNCCPTECSNASYLKYLPRDLVECLSYIRSITGYHDTAILLLIISCINIAMRGRYAVRLDDNWVEQLILYSIILAESGQKKSQLLDLAVSPHKAFEEKLISSFFSQKHRQREYAAMMKKGIDKLRKDIVKKASAESREHSDEYRNFFRRIADDSSKLADAVKEFETGGMSRPGLFIDSCTDKSLIRTMSERGGGHAIAQAEGNKLLDQMKDTRFDLNVFLKGYTMESYSHSTATGGETHIKNPFLNILMIVQPYIGARLYESERFAAVGLTPRFLPFFVSGLDTWHKRECGTTWYNLVTYNSKITAMLERNYTQDSEREIYEIGVTAEAYWEIKEFERYIAEKHEAAGPEHMKAFMRKLHGTAVRIVGIIHAWNYDNPEEYPISREEMLAGIHIAWSIAPHAEYALNPSGLCAYKNAQEILKWVRRHKHPRFDSKEIAQYSGVTATAKIFPALDLLEQHNMLTQLITPKKPRLCVMHPRFNYYN